MAVTTPTQIRIPEPLKPDAKAKAEAEGLDLSKVVTALLQAWVDGRITLPPPPQ